MPVCRSAGWERGVVERCAWGWYSVPGNVEDVGWLAATCCWLCWRFDQLEPSRTASTAQGTASSSVLVRQWNPGFSYLRVFPNFGFWGNLEVPKPGSEGYVFFAK